MGRERGQRIRWTALSVAAHAGALALVSATPARPERPAIEVLIARGPVAPRPGGLAPPRPPPATARRASGPASRGGGHRGIPVPRTVPDALPVVEVEAVPAGADEVLPLGGTPFAGEGGAGVGSGTGHGGGTRGSGGTDEADAGPPWLRKNVLRKIQRYVDRKPYPRLAELMGWRGTVRVRFVVRTDGSVEGVEVVTSSGYEVLDRAAVDAVKRAAPYDRPPAEQAVIVPVVWYLPT